MAPLKALEGEYPIIDSSFRHFCASHGIFSVEDLLIHDVYMLVALAEQLSNSERLKQGITQILSIIDNWHQPWRNGMELLEDAEHNKQVLPTGCEIIDMFLQGGLRQGHLTELVGPSSCGKTQVCIRAATSVAMKLGSVVFIDTGNSFSSKRTAEIVGQMSGPTDREDKQILQQVMKNILLIVDSISSLIASILGGSGAEGYALMVSAGFLLKELADKHNICVLVTNHMVGGEGGKSKPALGESWKGIPHVRLRLSRDHGSNNCTMTVLRHPYMGSGKTLNFMIS